jgi:hypothetical protein
MTSRPARALLTASRVLLAAALFLAPHAAFPADQCYMVYDEGYRQFMKQFIQLPKRAGNFSSYAECRSTLDQVLSQPQYQPDKGFQRTRCECVGGSGGESGSAGGGIRLPSGGSFQQQVASAVVSSFLNALLSGINAPPGPDGEAIRQKLQKQWADEEVVRKAAEKKRQEDLFRNAQATATALLGNRPAAAGGGAADASPAIVDDGAAYIGSGRIPALLRSSGAATEAEWAEARGWPARIDALRGKGSLTAAEAKELSELEAKRNGLWKRAASLPGLAPEERDALRLPLPLSKAGAVSASADDLIAAREKASKESKEVRTGIISTLVRVSQTAGLQGAIDTAAPEVSGHLGFMKIGWALSSGKPEEAAEPAVGWAAGKVVEKAPWLGARIGMVQGAGAVTTAAVQNTFEVIFDSTDKVVPGFLPPGMTGKEKWKEIQAELGFTQKAGMNGLGL